MCECCVDVVCVDAMCVNVVCVHAVCMDAVCVDAVCVDTVCSLLLLKTPASTNQISLIFLSGIVSVWRPSRLHPGL